MYGGEEIKASLSNPVVGVARHVRQSRPVGGHVWVEMGVVMMGAGIGFLRPRSVMAGSRAV